MDCGVGINSVFDNFTFSALRVAPVGERRGGLVLLHEIFGVDSNMSRDAQRWASEGFEVLVPSLFDRCEPDFTAPHDEGGIKRGFDCLRRTPDAQALGDIRACSERLAADGTVFVLGYCYGGRLAWLSANAIPGLAAAVTYYGNVLPHIELEPRCPVMLHFGAKDEQLPVADITAAMARRHEGTPVHVYASSGHGFNNDGAAGSDPGDAILARVRTQAFFERFHASLR